MSRRTLRIALGVVGGLLIALAVTRPGSTPAADFLQPVGPLLPQPFPAPELALLNPRGDTVRTQDLAGAPAALFFGYTNCPDVCPITLAQLIRVREALDLTPDEFRIVFITMDPERDTPEVLRRYVEGLGGDVIALRESEAEVWRQANQLGVQAMKGPPIYPDDPNSYLVEHSARTYLLDDRTRIVAALDPMAAQSVVRDKVEAVLEVSGNR